MRPKFSKTSKSNQYDYEKSEKFVLLCEAQAFPVPMFRFVDMTEIFTSVLKFRTSWFGSTEITEVRQRWFIRGSALSNV